MEDGAEELPNWRWVNFPPLPSNRKVELHRTKVEGVGELACAGCKAVKYCGHENAAAMEGTNETAVEENRESAMERKNVAATEGKNEGALEWKNDAAMGGKKFKNEGTRRGRECFVADIVRNSPLTVRRARENSLSVKGARLFNLLPTYLRDISTDKVDHFKSKLDKFLREIPDEPTSPEQGRVAESNGLLHQIPFFSETIS